MQKTFTFCFVRLFTFNPRTIMYTFKPKDAPSEQSHRHIRVQESGSWERFCKARKTLRKWPNISYTLLKWPNISIIGLKEPNKHQILMRKAQKPILARGRFECIWKSATQTSDLYSSFFINDMTRITFSIPLDNY